MRAEERLYDLEAEADDLEKKIKEHSFAWEMAKRAERDKKRWFYAWLITFILLIALVAGGIYLYATSEIDVFTLTQTTENGGDANYISAGGDVTYGIPENNGN